MDLDEKKIRCMKVAGIYELVQTDGRPIYKSVVDLDMLYLRLHLPGLKGNVGPWQSMHSTEHHSSC